MQDVADFNMLIVSEEEAICARGPGRRPTGGLGNVLQQHLWPPVLWILSLFRLALSEET